MKNIFTLTTLLFCAFHLNMAQEPEMISPGLTFVPRGLSTAVMDTIFYFTGFNADFDTELWRSDGTDAGTYEVINLNPSGASSPHSLVVLDEELFFLADSLSVTEQLFKTDGTEEGTEWIADVDNAKMETTHMLTPSGNLVYFRAYLPGIGVELWASNGTSEGTGMVKDICNNWASYPHELTDFNGILVFAAEDCGTPGNLYRSDGTAANTLKIGGKDPLGIRVFGDTLYCSMTFEGYGRELARSTGIPGSVEMIDEINPGAFGSDIYHLTRVDSMIFFRASHVDYGAELWGYNMNTGVVKLVKDIWPGSSGSSFPDQLISYKGKLIFKANDGTYGDELWISDGTEAGTHLLKNINVEPGGVPFGHSYPQKFYEAAGLLFFAADDGINGQELWQTDGTEEGTKMVYNIGYSYYGSDPGNFAEINGYLFFHAYYNNSYRLYKLKLPDTPVSIQPPATESTAFEIFPNPAGEKLTIRSQVLQNFKYRITDIQGKQIMNGLSAMSHQHKIDISALKPGLYFIRIENGDNLTIRKFVKQ